MSTGFKATTKSGATYTREPGESTVRYEHNGALLTFHNASLSAIPLSVIEAWERIEWQWIWAAPMIDLPIVGERLYIGTISAWRISTEIVSVEVIE